MISSVTHYATIARMPDTLMVVVKLFQAEHCPMIFCLESSPILEGIQSKRMIFSLSPLKRSSVDKINYYHEGKILSARERAIAIAVKSTRQEFSQRRCVT